MSQRATENGGSPPSTVLEYYCGFLPSVLINKCGQLSSLATRARQNAGQRSTRFGAVTAEVLPHGGSWLFMVAVFEILQYI